ncbi:MAG: chemotaxis protein CheR, partial [Anaerolineae bacterium]|nr:chemotaxis protein CheR [Anaerolineae bacterium]
MAKRKKKAREEGYEQVAVAEREQQEDSQIEVNKLLPEARDVPPSPEKRPAFPIIGLGASAGGLEAFEAFFKYTPPDSGLAFVLVQHLDPNHESILVDILKRATQMPVLQVIDGMTVQRDHIYVIPPNRDMALMNSTLHLLEPIEPRGFRMPIDYLFRSLAEEQRDRAIGIILSGTGSDGTLGLRAIRVEGGMMMVQDPETAKYDGMPRSAINTGLADYILPPEEMPAQLLSYVEHLYSPKAKRAVPSPPKETDALEKIFVLLRRQTGHDFSLYKQNTINRRIERRMVVNQVDRIADYVRYLQRTPLEVETLFRELLIGVTSFFRDPEAFAVLEHQAIPHLIEGERLGQPIRIWVPGCSTGEEAYSIAMLIWDQMGKYQQAHSVQIFATDIDAQAIEIARAGVYPNSIVADVSPEYLQRFFIKQGNTYQIAPQIREMVVFAIQSIIKDPPFSKMDLVSCRNLLIYLDAALQKKVVPLFHYALKPDGFLFLGTSETLGELERFFATVDR